MAPPILVIRQNMITTQAENIKNSFSSWDKCMQKAYCKWPVIVGIILVAGIVLSILFCVARCLCCGAECACCCFRCCAGCCGSGGRRRDGYSKQESRNGPMYPPAQPQAFPYNNQYQAPVQPSYRGAPSPAVAPKAQFAQFDSPSSPQHADSLPAMPTWESATSKKVEVWEEPETHEMSHLDQHGKDASAQPMLPLVDLPSPSRPDAAHSPYESFVGSNAGSQSAYSQGGYAANGPQSTGLVGAAQDSRSGFRSAAPNAPHSGYNSAGGYGAQRQYAQQGAGGYSYDTPHSPVSPMYPPSLPPAYDSPGNSYAQGNSYNAWTPQQQPQQRQQQHNPYASPAGMARKAAPGSWRDV